MRTTRTDNSKVAASVGIPSGDGRTIRRFTDLQIYQTSSGCHVPVVYPSTSLHETRKKFEKINGGSGQSLIRSTVLVLLPRPSDPFHGLQMGIHEGVDVE